MGKQIHFFQTQKDIEEFCQTLISHGKIIYDHKGEKFESFFEFDFLNAFYPNTEERVGCFYIANQTTVFDNSRARDVKYPSFNKQLIEFIPSRLSIYNDRYQDGGRFYLFNNLYDNIEMVALYKYLAEYIKKKYIYISDFKSYFSSRFMELYKTHQVVPCLSGVPLVC